MSARSPVGDFALSTLFMAATLMLAAVPPIVKVLRLKIVDAMGHV